ncbi:hypothetical protein VFPBJ_08693 [Purpureocillium lilacinum]|uniref:Uncharacterized protein n=1 Tax=Purpureocillium lilacinum TaxID=33203 RepID=A0A179GG36_PURLI|nr:hypothetical protein VFPBJ_08693 [Purpureocillium lilacinum]
MQWPCQVCRLIHLPSTFSCHVKPLSAANNNANAAPRPSDSVVKYPARLYVPNALHQGRKRGCLTADW